ncbi:MAG TPA: bifunctional adenosylcobinamide kinase/adenosylcobinamide-phosphate guanylyltransferase [Acidimicrobiia bacterium]|nr:bifunctional adenosylcobinamide kinase/adenosylcobinamide-phosphate guanylyltransferase [Acidimicrobiia bacterium]
MITLVLGGVRSGKSEVAERLAGPGPGTYLATGLVAPGDDDFAGRVARHRARRPASWATVEEPQAVPEVLARLQGTVLLDALGTWIANDLEADIDALVKALVHRPGDTIVVSEEVGLGVHPVTEVGRLFADRLGEANRRVAEVADRCLLVVAGRVLDLPAGRHPTDPQLDLLPGTPGPAVDDPRPQPVAPTRHPRPSMPPDRDRLHPMGAQIDENTRRGGFRQALAFLTPLGGAVSPSRAAFVWFPVVGALLGLVLGSIWWTTEDAVGAFGAAALLVAADLALTGALHFDGLLDSADGLLPHLPAERRLAVMAEPHVGAFAVATGATTLLLRTAALTALGTARPLLLGALWCLARTAMAVTAATGRYARPHGLASSFLSGPIQTEDASAAEASLSGRARPPSEGARQSSQDAAASWMAPAAIGTVLVLGLAAFDDPGSLVAVGAAGAAAAGVAALARRRIGGYTGDTLGAGGVVAETVGLLTAMAVLRP